MQLGNSNQRFAISWLVFGYALALHVLDEAGNDFLSVYIPNALWLRHAVPILHVPLFTFRSWVGTLLCGLAIWLALAPLAFHAANWQKRLAIPVAIVAGILNGLAHMLSSIYLWRWMPGVFSAPLILLSGVMLLREAMRRETAQL